MTTNERDVIDRRTVLKSTGTALAAGGALTGMVHAQEDRGRGAEMSASRSSITYSWFLEDCQATIAVVPVDADALGERLPEGFTPLTPEEFGLPPDPRGDAVIGLEAFTCERSAALNGSIEDAPYMSYFAPVEPPTELADPEVRFHFVKWDVLIADEALCLELRDAGVPSKPGTVEYGATVRRAEQFVFDVAGTLGDESHRVTGSGNQPDAEPETFNFIEFTPTGDGLVTWDVLVDNASVSSGSCRLELAPGSLPAEVIGSESTQAYVLAGDVGFPEATIEVPRGEDRARRK